MIKAKFGWTAEENVFYNTIMSSSSILGALLGAIGGGVIIKFGRRKVLLWFNIVAAIAITLTMFLSVELICLGRLLFGICAGVFLVAAPKMLDETIPVSHLAIFGTVTNTFLSLGITVAIMMGVVLPADGDI